QHTGVVTNALENVTPWSASRCRTFGIANSVSHRWSSVTIRTRFGRSSLPAGGGGITLGNVAPSHACPARLVTATTIADRSAASDSSLALREGFSTREGYPCGVDSGPRGGRAAPTPPRARPA